MKRNQLSDMSVFVEVARANGFRSAAEKLMLKPGSVSEAIKRFEDRVGVRLFERTTRAVALTPAGEQLYRRSLPAITDLEAAVRELVEHKDAVAGTLRLSAPYATGPFFLDKLVAKYAATYPEVNVELIYDDSKVDLVDTGIDAAIRSNLLLKPETHAVPIGPSLRMVLVASKGYLDRNGVPSAPVDLTNHDGICFAIGDGNKLAPWVFGSDEGQFTVMPKPRLMVNDLVSLMTYAKEGLGITYVYEEIARSEIEAGNLVSVLNGLIPPLPTYSLNYLTKKNMPRRLRAFIDLAKSFNRLGGNDVDG